MIQPIRSSVDLVQQHLQALHIGSEVTRWFRKEREPNVIDVTPENVLAALHRVSVNWVLMGVHGINVYRDEARATPDVDLLVKKRDVCKTARILGQVFPSLEVKEGAERISYLNPVNREVVIDVLMSSTDAIRAAFRHSISIGGMYRIPDLETALVSKFFTMTARDRRVDRRFIDAGDFINMVENNRTLLDLEKLKRLGELLTPRAGKKLLDLVNDIDAGRTIQP